MNNRLRKLVYSAMFAVINYVAFTFGKITIPVTAGTSTAIHIANAVVVLSSWFLGPVYGGLSGAIGLTIADLIDPRYILSAPKTFILKFMIGFIAGSVAGKLGLQQKEDRKEIVKITTIAAIAGLGFNVVFDPIVGYFYRQYILGIPQEAAKIIATWVAGASIINAIACVIVSVILYLALYKSFLNKVPK
ncbi:MAG: ECF transporter S component [Erysipelotrichaceae bacterium]|nr:ECF transporter S component [Erysipelotrichaceae bacterium]